MEKELLGMSVSLSENGTEKLEAGQTRTEGTRPILAELSVCVCLLLNTKLKKK